MKLYNCNGVVNRRLGAQGLGFLGVPEAPDPDIVAAPLVAIVPQAPVIELQVTELHVDMLHAPQPAAGLGAGTRVLLRGGYACRSGTCAKGRTSAAPESAIMMLGPAVLASPPAGLARLCLPWHPTPCAGATPTI